MGPLLSTLSETSTRDRPVKRRAMEALRKEVKTCPAPAELLSHVIDSFITCTESEIESVREQTVHVIEG